MFNCYKTPRIVYIITEQYQIQEFDMGTMCAQFYLTLLFVHLCATTIVDNQDISSSQKSPWCYPIDLDLPKTYVQFFTPTPVNVTLFGTKVFADVMQ